MKEKIQRVTNDRPDLFDGVSEDTSDRLDHLIATLDNQATQIDVLRAERDQMEGQLNSVIKDLQRFERRFSLKRTDLMICIVLV